LLFVNAFFILYAKFSIEKALFGQSGRFEYSQDAESVVPKLSQLVYGTRKKR